MPNLVLEENVMELSGVEWLDGKKNERYGEGQGATRQFGIRHDLVYVR